MRYFLWSLLTAVLRRLPTGISYAAADAAGAAAFACWPRGRRAAIANYHVVLGGVSRARGRRMARRSLQNYCRYLADFARFSGSEPAVLGEMTGTAHFDELRRRLMNGRGAIVTLLHAGNWDALGAAAVAAGIDVAVVAEPVGDDRFDRGIREARTRAGMRVLVMGRDTFSMARTLRRGGVLAVLVDRPDDGGVPVTFFGRETRVADGAARLALSTGAEVVAAACTRRSRDNQELVVRARFDLHGACGGERHEQARTLTQAIFTAHEQLIRPQPSQWYMFRRFWPSMPGEPT